MVYIKLEVWPFALMKTIQKTSRSPVAELVGEESLSFAKRMGKLWALEDAEPHELKMLESLPDDQAGWTQFFTDPSPDDSWASYNFLSLVKGEGNVGWAEVRSFFENYFDDFESVEDEHESDFAEGALEIWMEKKDFA